MKKFIFVIVVAILGIVNISGQNVKKEWGYYYACKNNSTIYNGDKEWVGLNYGYLEVEHYKNEKKYNRIKILEINPFTNNVFINFGMPHLIDIASVDNPNDTGYVLSNDPIGVPLTEYQLELYNNSTVTFTFIYTNTLKTEKYIFTNKDNFIIPINEFKNANKVIVEGFNKLENKTYKQEVSLIGFTKTYNMLMSKLTKK